jgi:23S rRNA pseudouridine1911/1915/1917 synthase
MNISNVESTESETDALVFHVEQELAGARLDAFLAERIEGWSRSRIQKLIDDGDVLVQGRSSRSSYKLRAGDDIDVDLVLKPVDTFVPEDIPLDVVFEDDTVMVVNKPAGLIVHPGAGAGTGTLANALAFHFSQISQRTGPARAGIVHRLDKDTSGLLVVAKTEHAHEILSDQFRNRTVFKSYVALAHGRFEQDRGEILEPISRDPKNRVRMAVIRTGRSAITKYRVRRRFDRFAQLDVEIKTGRTH